MHTRTLLTAALTAAALTACDDGKTPADDSACTESLWYADADADGYGDAAVFQSACVPPAGYVADATDCDDAEAFVRPGVDERCDDLDNDCDGDVDEEAVDASTWYLDNDEDGFGDDAQPLQRCEPIATHVATGGDCDDNNPEAFPGQVEICNGFDDDCDEATSELGMATFLAREGGIEDYTDRFDGGPGGAAEISLTERGELRLCPGTWYARLDVETDITLTGVGGRDAVVLDGAGEGPIVRLFDDQYLLVLEGLTLTNAIGDYAINNTVYGGAVECEGDSELEFYDVRIHGNSSAGGTALFSNGCPSHFEDSEIDGNTGSYTGALLVGDASVDLVDTRVWGNTSGYGAGLALFDGEATCTSVNDPSAGFYANVADNVAGGVMLENSSFTSRGCDFGEPGSANDNSPEDIATAFYYGYRYTYGDDLALDCDVTRCGTASAVTVGQTGSAESQSGASRGNVLVADEESTLESFEVYLSATSTGCSVYFTVLEADSASAGIWTVRAVRSVRPAGTASAYLASGDLGVPLVPGRAYATVVGSSCSLNLSPTDANATSDAGPAQAGANYWVRSGTYAPSYGEVVATNVLPGSPNTVYASIYHWSH